VQTQSSVNVEITVNVDKMDSVTAGTIDAVVREAELVGLGLSKPEGVLPRPDSGVGLDPPAELSCDRCCGVDKEAPRAASLVDPLDAEVVVIADVSSSNEVVEPNGAVTALEDQAKFMFPVLLPPMIEPVVRQCPDASSWVVGVEAGVALD
jgi:hypothetical protein